MAINYFSQLGFDQGANQFMQAAQGAQGLRANEQAMQMNSQNMQRQQAADQQAMLKFASEQQRQQAAQGAGAFYNALNSGNDQAALQIAQQYQQDINSLGDPSFTVKSVVELMKTPEGKEQLKQMSLGMVQMAGGPEQMARFTAAQAKPQEQTTFEQFNQLEAQRQQIEREQGPDAAARFATMAKLSSRPVSEVNVNLPTEKQDVKIAELDAAAFTDYSSKAKSARKEINTIGSLKSLSERALSGTGASALLGAGKLLNQLGLEIEGLTESEVFNMMSNSLVLDKSQQLSGALSDGDMLFLKGTVPGLTTTKEGRRLQLDIAERLARREIAVAEESVKFRREAKKQGREFDDAEFQMYVNQWADQNPLFEDLSVVRVEAPSQAIEYLKANPQLKEDFRQRYGYIPEGFE